MLNKLLPQEEMYFEEFKDLIATLEEMAYHVEKIFQFEDQQNHILKLKPLEIRGDEISSGIEKRLKSFIPPPFDREDIFALVKSLDDISDMLLEATVRFNIDRKNEFADKLSSIIKEQVRELGAAIQNLKPMRLNEVKAVKVLEMEVDRVYKQAVEELFKNEKNAIELIKKKEIIDLLKKTSDKCKSTANFIISIFLKNS